MKTLKLTLIIGALILSNAADAQVEPIDQHGLAIGGYDVVAYFSGEAKRGFQDYIAEHMGATYYFSSKDNKKAFEKNPEAYLPQFGGFCAWAVAVKKKKLTTNPETFDVVYGKLYLFFNGPAKDGIFNTLVPWGAETTKLIEQAHTNWNDIKYLL